MDLKTRIAKLEAKKAVYLKSQADHRRDADANQGAALAIQNVIDELMAELAASEKPTGPVPVP